MNSSILLINGIAIDKIKLMQYIQSNRKLQAIKFLREATKIGLKESKDIVDILTFNPDFYPNNEILTSTEIGIHEHISSQKSTRSRRGSHVITSKTNQRKQIMIIFVLASIITMMYFYFIA